MIVKKLSIEERWHEQAEAFKRDAEKMPHGKGARRPAPQGTPARDRFPYQRMGIVAGAFFAPVRPPQSATSFFPSGWAPSPSDIAPSSFGQGNKVRSKRKKKLRSTVRTQHWGAGTMDRDTLLFRVSLIWLAVVAAGCVYVLLKL